MTTSIQRLVGNFTYHLESITPTNTLVSNRFELYDPLKDEVSNSTGGFRKFYLEYVETEEDILSTDIVSREAWTVVVLHIKYPVRVGYNDTQNMMLEDRHQVIKKLRDSDARVGYRDNSGTDTTADIGLMWRVCSGTSLSKESPELWELAYTFRCLMQENE